MERGIVNELAMNLLTYRLTLGRLLGVVDEDVVKTAGGAAVRLASAKDSRTRS